MSILLDFYSVLISVRFWLGMYTYIDIQYTHFCLDLTRLPKSLPNL